MRLPTRYSPAALLVFMTLLYAGPILAGLLRATLPVLLTLILMFLLYMVGTRRPDLWTRAGWLSVGVLIPTQAILCALCYGMGWFLAHAVGTPDWPIWLPLACTGLAVVMGLLLYRHNPELDLMLDEAQAALDGTSDYDFGPSTSERVDGYLFAFSEAPLSIPALDKIARRMESQLGADALPYLTEKLTAFGGSDGEFLGTLRYLASPRVRDLMDRDETFDDFLAQALEHPVGVVQFEARSLATLIPPA